MNSAAVYILLIYFAGGVEIQEFTNFESCKAAKVLIEEKVSYYWVRGLCIPKDVTQ